MHPLDCTVSGRVRQWIEEEVGEGAAEMLTTAVASLLTVTDENLEVVTASKWRELRERLRAAGVTPTLLEQVARETKRAREEGLTLREFARQSYERRFTEDQAQAAEALAETIVDGFEQANDLDDPLEPEDALMYRLVMQQAAPTAGIEERRIINGGLPRN